MDPGTKAKLRLTASKEDAIAAIRASLPDDAIVRDQDDGIGRFAGERVVMLIGAGGAHLMMSRGNWRLMKTLEESPQLDITIEETKGGCTVELMLAEPKQATLGTHARSVLSNGVTLAVLVVAYHMYQDLEVDPATVAAISLGGGALWTAVAHFWPTKRDDGLDKTVRVALHPMRVPKKRKKKKKKDTDLEGEDASTDVSAK